MIDKTKYKEVAGGQEFVRMWPEKDEALVAGSSIEGRYRGASKGTSKAGDEYVIHSIDVDGVGMVGVWGGAVLNIKLGNVAEGKMIAIEYLGEEPSKKRPGKKFRNFWVGYGIDAPNQEGDINSRKVYSRLEANDAPQISDSDLPF